MNRRLHLITITAAILTSGCVATSDIQTKLDNISQNQEQIKNSCTGNKDQIMAEIKDIKATSTLLSSYAQDLENIKNQNNRMAKQIEKMEQSCGIADSSQNDGDSDSVTQTKEVVYDVKNTGSTYDGKIILGAKEWTLLEKYDLAVETRVDTGATTSSINAMNIEKFERDGKKWVKFNLPDDNGSLIPIEARFARETNIVQSSDTEQKQTRVVAKIKVKVGSVSKIAEFTLVDRSHMSYPLLLGREFMKDEVLVDVSKDFNQGKPKADIYINKKTFYEKNGQARID